MVALRFIKKLHIADSENNYTWVSTMGLVASIK